MKKTPLPSNLRSIPKGYAYLGKGGEFKRLPRDDCFLGYNMRSSDRFNESERDGTKVKMWSGCSHDSFYFAPVNSEIAKLNIKPRVKKPSYRYAFNPRGNHIEKFNPNFYQVIRPSGYERVQERSDLLGIIESAIREGSMEEFTRPEFLAKIKEWGLNEDGTKIAPPKPTVQYVIAGKSPWFSSAYIKIEGGKQTLVSKSGFETPYEPTDTHLMVERGDWLYADEKTALSRLDKPTPTPPAPKPPERPSVKQGNIVEIEGEVGDKFIVARTTTQNDFFLISLKDGNRWDDRAFPLPSDFGGEIPTSVCSKGYKILKREDVFKA